jgi:(p)ppGpp synthase/HD superfamily hydrolase
LCAAILHDTVEDTQVQSEDLIREFGRDVASLVFWLTDVSKKTDGNRRARKEIDRRHIASAPYVAKSIKLADLIDNAIDIGEHDPDFAQVYMREKARLLFVLTDAHPVLLAKATAIVLEHKYGYLDCSLELLDKACEGFRTRLPKSIQESGSATYKKSTSVAHLDAMDAARNRGDIS